VQAEAHKLEINMCLLFKPKVRSNTPVSLGESKGGYLEESRERFHTGYQNFPKKKKRIKVRCKWEIGADLFGSG